MIASAINFVLLALLTVLPAVGGSARDSGSKKDVPEKKIEKKVVVTTGDHGEMVVDSDSDFGHWATVQLAGPAAPAAGTVAERGKAVFARSACIGCHTIQGVSPGVIGPNLTHVGSRTTIASGLFPNDSAHLASWIADAPALKPGSLMTRLKPPLTDADIAALVAYLASLK